MKFAIFLLVLVTCLLSITCAAPWNSQNMPVSEALTIGQNSIMPSILDTLRDVFSAKADNATFPRAVADHISLASNAPVSAFNTSTVDQSAIKPSMFDTLRDIFIANPINAISSRTVADDSNKPVHNISSSARVANTTADIFKNMTSPAAIHIPGTELHWKHSLQILFREYNGYFSWYMYQGPFGVPVNPCGDNRFNVLVRNSREARKGLSLMEPPMVAEGTKWYINTIDSWSDRGQCSYQAAANDPGHLVCGDFLDYPVSKDAGYHLKPLRCARGKWDDGTYHRAWVVEY